METMQEINRTAFVGNAATVNWWSDSKAGTIIQVSPSGKRITVQLDKSTRTDKNGMSDCQHYEYERDINGATYEFSLRKNGRWVVIGHETRHGVSCTIGGRYTYHDFSF
jgi:hypothetical protein